MVAHHLVNQSAVKALTLRFQPSHLLAVVMEEWLAQEALVVLAAAHKERSLAVLVIHHQQAHRKVTTGETVRITEVRTLLEPEVEVQVQWVKAQTKTQGAMVALEPRLQSQVLP